VSEDNNVRDLLQRGIEALKSGDRATARELLEQVVELDENNETAWLALAQVLPTEAEKRVALSNVLFLNPDNERAQKLMERLKRKDTSLQEDEIIPGVSRKQIRWIAIGGGVVLVLLLLLIVLLTGGGPSDEDLAATDTVATQVALLATQNAAATAQAQGAEGTLVEIEGGDVTEESTPGTPTDVPTATQIAQLPTELPSPTPFAEIFGSGIRPQEPLPPPPPEVTGTIAAWGGRDIDNNDFYTLRLYQIAAGGEFTTVADNFDVRDVDLSPDGQQLLYTRFFPTSFSFGVERSNINATQPQFIAEGNPILKIEMARFCASGNSAVFVAVPQNINESQVYTFDFTTNTLLRLTNDNAVYTFPSFSPTCDRVVVVKNDVASASPGEDLVIIDTTSLTQTPLTNDRTDFIESSPRWSPDGTKIIYVATPSNSPNESDLIQINVDGSGIPIPIARDPAVPDDNRFPVYSPDGRYLAFSSNRRGQYNIFIVELATDTIWQLTNDPNPVFPGGWS